ncbi:17-beta-hydroxysteroid dehydrogenase type 6-like isoform X1 [Nycticebus coucang]|uniref:17-beta-hydroxysteroid dehydrogenase type 6-like isoform X1 n=2 Tax=Nycticebus coucang TaxID=9470 RepID=UPI00234CADF1|nr:17-beta-hydroxysteroid dehydrogenase type 6-like isoform X1 [Nycticebus coucang]XP_053413545.1 17-beta-hydroxysteroid dehydrogenase type 6-like isoform X1 [Nycticebus coucang]
MIKDVAVLGEGRTLNMWLYLAALVGLYYLLRWYRERQVVSHLQDKYIFITGCDSGFGNLLARQLDARGLRVLAACLTEKGAEQLKAQTSDRLETVSLDVTKTESVTAATQWVKERIGDRGLWGLVNNAGIIDPIAFIEWQSFEDSLNILKVNLIGLVQVTLSMLPLVRRAQGRIVNVSSILGRIASFGGVYSSSKHGVEGFSDILRRELRHFGVKVSIIEPGYFRTGMTDMNKSLGRLKQAWEEAPMHIKESYGQHFFDAYYNVIKEGLIRCSTNLNLVTDCMEHALTSVHPRTRYSAGWDAQFYFIPLSYLPTSLADYILSRYFPKPARVV